MKVVHLVPSMESGGVEQVVLELGRGFSAQGVENIVISGGGRMVEQLEKEGSRHILMPIGKKSLSTFFRIGALRALLQAIRPDILHLHSRVPAWAGYLAWKKLPPEDRAETARARVAELKEGNKELDAAMTQAATDMQNVLYTIPNKVVQVAVG